MKRIIFHGLREKKAGIFLSVAIITMLAICGNRLTVHAEEGAYATTIAALEAENLNQKLIVKAKGLTFEKTLAEFGNIGVIVMDNPDGSRICHMPDKSAFYVFIEEINAALTGVPGGEAFYYFDEESGQFQTYTAVSYPKLNTAGSEMIYHKLLEILAENKTANKVVETDDTCFEQQYVQIPDNVIKNKYSIKGSCTTSLKGSSSNRIKNIQIAVGSINLLPLYPGQEISISTAFKPRTVENGYREAGAYLNGKTVQSLGGGICQASSTIYNAAMNSGLTILERHPHSMPVSYLPLGMDAAIASGTKDLRLRNDYPFPVLLEGYTEGKTVTVNIYTNELQTAGASYRLHAVRRGSLAADTYLEISLNGTILEDRLIGTSKYNPHLPEEEEEETEKLSEKKAAAVKKVS